MYSRKISLFSAIKNVATLNVSALKDWSGMKKGPVSPPKIALCLILKNVLKIYSHKDSAEKIWT